MKTKTKSRKATGSTKALAKSAPSIKLSKSALTKHYYNNFWFAFILGAIAVVIAVVVYSNAFPADLPDAALMY